MPRARFFAFALALAAAFGSWIPARAEVIDFDPSRDPTVPTILTQPEIDLYNKIRTVQVPGVSQISPDGKFAIITVRGQAQVLDTTTKEVKPANYGGFATIAPWIWQNDTDAFALARRGTELVKWTYSINSQAIVTSTVTPGTLTGKTLTIIGGTMTKRADGVYYVGMYTQTAARPPLVFERETFAPDSTVSTGVTVEETDPKQPDIIITQTPEQLLIMNVDTGAITPVGSIPSGTDLGIAVNSLAIQPNGDTVSYVTGYTPPWTGKVVGGRANRGGGMPTSYWNVQEALGLVPEAKNIYLTRRALHIVNVKDAKETTIQNSEMPLGRFDDTLWTADGTRLLVPTAKPSVMKGRPNPEYEYPAGLKLRMFKPDGSFIGDWQDPRMDALGTGFAAREGSKLLVTALRNLSRATWIVDVADPTVQPTAVYLGDRYLYSSVFGGDTWVGVLADATDPGDIFIAKTANVTGTLERYTNLQADIRATAAIKFQTIKYTTSHGVPVEGAYIYPASWSWPPAKPGPVVVWQQGGPGGSMNNTWGTSVESPYTLLPAFGIPVFLVNGSGRLTNGAQYYTDMADGTNFGQRDIQDVKDGVDELIELGVVDKNKIGVTGCSYGGYFTMQSMVEFPDYYHAGNAQCSLNDLIWEYNLGWSPFLAYLMGSSTTGNPEEYIKDSPQYMAHKIKHPLLLFDGTDDFLPFELITNIHDELINKAVPTDYFRGRGYGHGFGAAKGDNTGTLVQRYAAQLQISWFRKHLGVDKPTFNWLALFPQLPTQPIEREVAR